MSRCPGSLDEFLAFLDEAPRDARAREATYREWLSRALPAIADELTETLPPEMRAAGVRFAVDGAGMSGWDAVDDALMYGVGNPPDPWCPDAGCAHADVRHKHTRLFRKPCVIAEDGTILEAER